MTKKLAHNYLHLDTQVPKGTISSVWDSHNVIETLMIMTNHRIAKFLYKNQSENRPIYRIHIGRKSASSDLANLDNIPDNLATIVKQLQTESAEYIFNPKDGDDVKNKYYHDGLQLNFYTHFTSPLRRLVDLYIHDRLDENSSISLLSSEDLERINTFNKQTKRLERDISWLKLVYSQDISKQKHDGYIIKIGKQRNKLFLTIYLSDLKVIIDYYPISEELEDLITYSINDTHNKVVLFNGSNDHTVELSLYQKLNIQIFSHPKHINFRQKLSLKIAELDKLFSHNIK